MLFVEIGGEFVEAERAVVLPPPDLRDKSLFHQRGQVLAARVFRPSHPGGEVCGVALVDTRAGLGELMDEGENEELFFIDENDLEDVDDLEDFEFVEPEDV